ncbi:guanine nucleotide exchange factor subunit Rich [Culicoides brevitarsis]|uniref:guanine nucleotide exchange factor subunit Rich n=1 Tax=Culicoides brevitarsis TaxID=469753 RepID=UPI00307BA9B6
MYFPLGWPRKLLNTSETLLQIACDRVKILFAVLSSDTLTIWYSNKPCVPIISIKRSTKCLTRNGENVLVEWKPDSTKLAVVTTGGTLLIYDLELVETAKGIYNQLDSQFSNLRRDSAELFIKEKVPSLKLTLAKEVQLFVPIKCLVCVTISHMMVAIKDGKIVRLNWNGTEERDYTLELNRTPFSINQQVSSATPIFDPGIFVVSIDYSPLLGGFAIVLNDGRAAFLTAPNLKFDPNQVQGIWAPNVDDASCISINHKYRLIAVGRKNSHVCVFTIDDLTGALELSHTMVLSSKDFPGSPDSVKQIKWTPDGCAVIVSWEKGGFSLWSTFGSMLTCSLAWDYGLVSSATSLGQYFNISCMDWSCEGYQLMIIRQTLEEGRPHTELLQLDFIKSALSVNPCVSLNPFLLLQGDDKILINHNETLETIYHHNSTYNELMINNDDPSLTSPDADLSQLDNFEIKSIYSTSFLSASKHWISVMVPTAYTNANWPVRFSALDKSGNNLAVAGRTGLALYSLTTRKWKLFGNETQEKDFVVTGGLVWWNEFVILGNYSLVNQNDEIRIYSRDQKLDNKFAKIFEVSASVMLMNIYEDQLIVFTADSCITIFCLIVGDDRSLELLRLQVYDIKNICIHPAFVASIFLTNLKHDSISKVNQSGSQMIPAETIVLNVAGRVLMIQKESNGNSCELMTTCLASCVECIWFFVDFPAITKKLHLKESLWLYCGGHGMRVWLPVFPREFDGHRSHRHTFMAKRIMLSFELKIYPLAISFEEAIIFGAETDTVLYTNDQTSHFSLPFSTLKRTSQVYLHQILKQLIKRNLGYNAWEIARSCSTLPYFPHSLELLLHEVLEQEATSKEPIPDALLPSVIEFIQEFPVYLQTVVQCARKTEIALWPYLFATAGKPKELFQQCMANKQLHTATNYLIILQNLESSTISKQYATLLLDASLEQKNWNLSHDLVRFLKAIDPNDTDSPRTSFVLGGKLFSNAQSPPVNPDDEDLSLILTHMTPRNSFQKNFKRTDSNKPLIMSPNSVEDKRRESGATSPTLKNPKNRTFEDLFIDPILFRHLKILLEQMDFQNLGYMSAALDIQLVTWLSKEKEKLPKIDDFVQALKKLHATLDWPKPSLNLKLDGTPDMEMRGDQSPGSPSGSKTLQSSNQSSVLESRDSGYSSTFLQAMETANMTMPIREKNEEDVDSVLSEMTAVWENELVHHHQEAALPINHIPAKKSKKLEVQMRYMLQIFTEANCLDFSLLLSILLLDSTSVSRVCHAAIRSASLSICRQLKNGLKDLTRWSFNECLGYRAFMLGCSEEIASLDRFVTQQESIPDLPPNIYPNGNEGAGGSLLEKTPVLLSRSASLENGVRKISLGKSETLKKYVNQAATSDVGKLSDEDKRNPLRKMESSPQLMQEQHEPSIDQDTSNCAIM